MSNMATTLRLQAIALAVLLSRLAPASAKLQPPPLGIARPGCRDRCGNITVPYPFGIGAGCHRDDGLQGFQLVCDDTRSPPRLTIYGYNYQLSSLALDAGEARTYLNATRQCYNATGGFIGGRTSDTYMSLGTSPYLFSPAKNRLVALGCPNLGYFSDMAGYYVSGCMSVCRPSQYAIPGECTGVGCCQSAIPPGVNFFEPNTLNVPQGQGDSTFNTNVTRCRYVFLVEAEWFRYSDSVYLNRTDDFAVPVVLDWAVRNVGNCSAAKRNTTDYACRSANSGCVDSSNGAGYRCNCSKGYEGNPYLNDGCRDIDECQHKDEYPCYGVCTNTPGNYTCKCPPGTSGDASTQNGCRDKDKFTLALKVVTGVSVGVFLSVFVCFWLYLGLQKRKLIRTKQKFFEQNGGVLLQQQMRSYSSAGAGAGGFKIFSKEELEKATINFADDRVLGRGGHGIVYKGILEDETVVAIKKSKMMEEAQTKEFAREMFILSQINHRNVVKLLGCCLEVEVPMLVYEFVSNGTLYHYIHDKDLKADITFDTRLRIAVESAEALAYMHSSASPPILHGDVKTANILLDDKLTAKVSDFGASKLAPTDEAEIATLVQGTCGYLDPEYLMTCQLTDKSDVYSFGVVLLELLTRKKALYLDGPEENRSLVSSFMTALKAGRYEELLDSQVRNEMRADVLEEIAHLVVRCLSMSGEERPTMKEAAERLEMLRRYQQHPWVQAGGNAEERQNLLGMEQQNLPYKFRQQDVLDLEEGSTYTFSL
ncbi:wall-associated receptor kinase 1-like [Phragmites australis]|uniref:wall-associated receptor kinase 1-like n=1 Tax=Phragmites australis TaxID=29695 RepID=UPI002D79BB27|nr:wall-associated receptor kinase 1-like [Phragmites australis]